MMCCNRISVILVLLVMSVFAAPVTAAGVTDAQVVGGIEKLKKKLFSLQKPDGSFETHPGGNQLHFPYGGDTAMAVYALLAAGESYQDPRLAKAIAWLEKADMKGVYAVSARTHVWSHLPDRFRANLEKDVSWMLDIKRPPPAAKDGSIAWAYTDNNFKVHTSTGQYGVLALWEGAKRGIPIPRYDWKGIEAYYLTSQNPDGGWSYDYASTKPSRLSMALAGLTCLYITQGYLHRDAYRDPASGARVPVNAYIERGLDYVDKNFKAKPPSYFPWYTLYGVERVGLASGRKYFNGMDWYATGAKAILDHLKKNAPFESHGYKAAGHAFALLFLVRGRVPTLVNKLEIPDHDWNNRPRDLASLTEWVSNQVERRMNWQVISIDREAEDWLDAPVLFLSGQKALDLSDEQLKKIKRYIDMGGLLITSADRASESFTRSVADHLNRIYPDYELKPVDPDDEINSIVFNVDTSRLAPQSLHNGVRHLVIHLPRGDASWLLHSESHADPAVWQWFVNVYFHATEKGEIRPRLDRHFMPRAKQGGGDSRVVGRVRYEGNWNPEPLAWKVQSNFMYNAKLANVTVKTVTFEDLDARATPFAHVAGTEDVAFTDSQIDALKRFVEAKGVILFENVGGTGVFTQSTLGMLRKAFPNQRVRPVSLSSPIITGAGIGGANVSEIEYRLYTQMRAGPTTTPRLMSIFVDGEPRIIVSSDDLSYGMLGQPSWGVYGYSTPSARKIVSNLILSATMKNVLAPN